MGVIDVVLIVFILVFAIKGLMSGFFAEIIGLLGIILAILCSYMIYSPLYGIVQVLGLSETGTSITTYILGFIIVYVIVVLLGKLLQKTLEAIYLGWVNKIFGFVVGAFKGAVIVSIILWIIVAIIPNNIKFVQDIKKSEVAQFTMKILPYCYNKLNSISNIDRFNPFL